MFDGNIYTPGRVLDNLKDYSVKALVNAVDHLGTVAYKLNDLLSQQTTEISSTELRAASLAQVSDPRILLSWVYIFGNWTRSIINVTSLFSTKCRQD